MASFDALPAEIILHIHLLSTSSTLPHVSKYIHSCIRSSSTPSYRARWLLRRLAREGYAPAPLPSTSSLRSATSRSDTIAIPPSASSISSSRLSNASDDYGDFHLSPAYSSSIIPSSESHSVTNGSRTIRGRRRRKEHDNNDKEDSDALFLNKALKYPICNLETLLLLESICLKGLNERIQCKFKERQLIKIAKLRLNHGHSNTNNNSMTTSSSNKGSIGHGYHNSTCLKEEIEKIKEEKVPPFPKFLPVPPRFIDIPKRLFRNLQLYSSSSSLSSTTPTHVSNSLSEPRSTSPSLISESSNKTANNPSTFDTEDLPLLKHLLLQLHANPNSSRGYPLAKAVLARHVPLINLLLKMGADPSFKDYMAVMLAIGRKDLEIVRLLIERHEDDIGDDASWSSSNVEKGDIITAIGRKRKRNEGGSHKKRRLEDRINVTSDMLELAVKQGSESLIQFFMSKGAVPSLKTLQMLQA